MEHRYALETKPDVHAGFSAYSQGTASTQSIDLATPAATDDGEDHLLGARGRGGDWCRILSAHRCQGFVSRSSHLDARLTIETAKTSP